MVSILLRKGKVSQDFRHYFFFTYSRLHIHLWFLRKTSYSNVFRNFFCEKFGGNRHFGVPFMSSNFFYLLSSRCCILILLDVP